jgi:hypothetical protein
LGRIEQRDLRLDLPMFYTSKMATVSSLFHKSVQEARHGNQISGAPFFVPPFSYP